MSRSPRPAPQAQSPALPIRPVARQRAVLQPMSSRAGSGRPLRPFAATACPPRRPPEPFAADPRRPAEAPDPAPCRRPRRQPPLDLPLAAPAVVTRQRDRGGPESPPSHRYAGDWSVCGRELLSGPDYDHVTGSDSDSDDDEDRGEAGGPRGAADFDDDEDAFEAPFNPHLNLKDFDALILDLERELSKQIHVCL